MMNATDPHPSHRHPCTRTSVLLIGALGFLAGCDLADPGEPPYPPAALIIEVSFGDPMKATPDLAGDNWPIAWADDGHLYTAWGDGQGPRHPDDERVSMGFARVEGGPTDARLFKIDSPDEQVGDGPTGRKASGMLMVDGILYMWVRNHNQAGEECGLWWSPNHAETWQRAQWSFSEFGYCTFINFGSDYQGARDEYVYMVSHDHPSAYEYADAFILARVPKDRIEDRDAYEFFQELDEDGTPMWGPDKGDRGSVFDRRGRAQRSSITYNSELGRYLWWQSGWPNPDGEDSRFNDSPLGIYEAPEPWGPWRTVFHTEEFPGGPGETGTFPTKWMGPVVDGEQVLYMVTSTDDAFTIWPVTFRVEVEPQ